MTHQTVDGDDPRRLSDIIAADEATPSFARQVLNGITGAIVLLAMGMLVLVVVLWRAP